MKTAWLTAELNCQAPTTISGSPTSCTQRGISIFRGLSGDIPAMLPTASALARVAAPALSAAHLGYPGRMLATRQRQRRRRRTVRRRNPHRMRRLVVAGALVAAVLMLVVAWQRSGSSAADTSGIAAAPTAELAPNGPPDPPETLATVGRFAGARPADLAAAGDGHRLPRHRQLRRDPAEPGRQAAERRLPGPAGRAACSAAAATAAPATTSTAPAPAPTPARWTWARRPAPTSTRRSTASSPASSPTC